VAARLLARPGALAQAFVQVLPHDLRHARATALEAAAVTAA
jgi:integrase